jgi:3-hydroxyisobutyrate dehydrogenase
MSESLPRIGFIGLGRMGEPMAECLIRAGFSVIGQDAVPGRAAEFAARTGASAAETPFEAVANAHAIITMLPSSREVATVIEAALPAFYPGQLVLEMSSGAPDVTKTLGEKLRALGVAMIDAPVSGGVSRARDGTLAIMAGGSDEDLDRAEPILRATGTTIHRVGGLGAGQAMKALNNLVSAAGFLAGIEVLLVGQRFGLDPERMVDVLNASTGMTNSSLKKFKQFVLSRKFDSGFGLDLMLKDLTIALDLARQTDTPAPFSAQCRELAAASVAQLGKGRDHTEFARVSEILAGCELHGKDSQG